MYKSTFQDLVNIATLKSDEYFSDEKTAKPNPYYIGFGNPNARLLLIGQEKAIDDKKESGKIQMKVESADNPYQWKKLIEEKITDLDYIFENPTPFRNPLFPYNGKPRKGNTWNQYQLFARTLFPTISDRPNSFLTQTFITEVNHRVSSKKTGNERNAERVTFMTHDFFKSFPMTIIAAGDYLKSEEIENQFDVELVADLTEPYRKLMIFENIKQHRILINTRQFSNFFFNKETRNVYFDKICNSLQKFSI